MKTKVLYAALLFLPLLFTSCKKENINEFKTGKVELRLMNDTSYCAFEEVNIDIRSVEVHIAGSTGGDWYKLNSNAGIYNLVGLGNTNFAIIAGQEIPTGEITAVKLKLGSQNSVRKNGVLYDVSFTPEDEAGLQAEVFAMVDPSTLKLRIDFSAGQSIHEDASHGTFQLKPVLKAYRTN